MFDGVTGECSLAKLTHKTITQVLYLSCYIPNTQDRLSCTSTSLPPSPRSRANMHRSNEQVHRQMGFTSLLFIILPLLLHHPTPLILKVPRCPCKPASRSSYTSGNQYYKHWKLITHSTDSIIPLFNKWRLKQWKSKSNSLSSLWLSMQAQISIETSKVKFICNWVLIKAVILPRKKSKRVT